MINTCVKSSTTKIFLTSIFVRPRTENHLYLWVKPSSKYMTINVNNLLLYIHIKLNHP